MVIPTDALLLWGMLKLTSRMVYDMWSDYYGTATFVSLRNVITGTTGAGKPVADSGQEAREMCRGRSDAKREVGGGRVRGRVEMG